MLVLASTSHYRLLSARTAVLLLLPAPLIGVNCIFRSHQLTDRPRRGCWSKNSSFWLVVPRSRISGIQALPSVQSSFPTAGTGFSPFLRTGKRVIRSHSTKTALAAVFKVCFSSPGEALLSPYWCWSNIPHHQATLGSPSPSSIATLCMAPNRAGLLS